MHRINKASYLGFGYSSALTVRKYCLQAHHRISKLQFMKLVELRFLPTNKTVSGFVSIAEFQGGDF